MLDEATISRYRSIFPLYSDAMIEAHWYYYKNCDPMYFLRLAAQFDLPAYISNVGQEGFDLLGDNRAAFERTKASFLRYIRYLSSERLIVLLVSGYPLGPAPRTFKSLSNEKLLSVLSSISRREVPEGNEVTIDGARVPFSAWLDALLFQGCSVDHQMIQDFERFLTLEASLLQNREAINAFKHGRALFPVNGQAFQITSTDTSGSSAGLVKEMRGAAHWLSWEEKSSPQIKEQSLILGFEETDSKHDYEIIKYSAAVEKLIVDIRSGIGSGDKDLTVFLPDLDNRLLTRGPQRLNLRISTTWKPGKANGK